MDNKGFSLIEILLAIGLFSIFVTGIVGAIIYGREASFTSGNRTSATFLAQEGLEASRTIRDAAYANLIDGTYGLATTGSKWSFSGSSDTSGIYTRTIGVSSVDASTKQIVATVTWQQTLQRSGSVALTSYLTNQTVVPASSSLVVSATGANLSADKKTLQGITLQNTGTGPIVIDKINVSWTPNLPGRQDETATINGTSVWDYTGTGTPTGRQNNATLLNVVDYSIPAGSTVPFTMVFSGSNSTNTFTVTFTLSDGSTKTVTTGILI